jgi:parvulin-like peptidyl-prolyl isomerase
MKSYLFIITLLFFAYNLFAQNDESAVAQIGNEIITAKEFKLRYELSPYIPFDKNIDPDSIKYDFLYSLIAEKLWAKDAEDIGMTKTDEFNFIFRPLEEMFVRDALFKIEVEDKVLLSAHDIENGISKSQAKLSTQIISTRDSLTIYDLYNKFGADTNYDSLISDYRNLTNNLVDISLGTLKDEEIEDSLYSLPVNGFTAPIKSEVGWVIFIIRNKIFTPIELGNQQSIDNMKKVIRNRRIERRYEEYLKEILGGITININPEAFNLIYSKIWKTLKTKRNLNDSTNYFELSEFDFTKIYSSLDSDNLNKQFFQLSGSGINTDKFLSYLSFNRFHVTQLDSTIILQKLNQRAKRFVEEQMITQEAYKRGLQYTPEVRNDLKIWQDNYLAQLYFNNNLDSISITDKAVYNYYLDELVNASNIRLINIRLVSIKDLDEVSNIFELLKQGTDFGDLVKNYGKTDTLVNENGETGLKPILLLGYVGSVASDLELNEIYGPIKRNNAYTILQVIERQESSDSLKLSFESIKDQLRNDLRFKAVSERLKKITSNLAQQNNVKIFSDMVDNIQTSQIPMFVHRLMGFGGRIAGVPLTTPFSGWINEEVKQKLLP